MNPLKKILSEKKLYLPEINNIVIANHYITMLETWKKQNFFNEKVFSNMLVTLFEFLSYYHEENKNPFVLSYLKIWWNDAKGFSDKYSSQKVFFLTHSFDKK